LLNEDAQGEAWLFKMTVSDASQMDEFMTEAAYQKYI
jgi:glycine cleavage system H protein